MRFLESGSKNQKLSIKKEVLRRVLIQKSKMFLCRTNVTSHATATKVEGTTMIAGKERNLGEKWIRIRSPSRRWRWCPSASWHRVHSSADANVLVVNLQPWRRRQIKAGCFFNDSEFILMTTRNQDSENSGKTKLQYFFPASRQKLFSISTSNVQNCCLIHQVTEK